MATNKILLIVTLAAFTICSDAFPQSNRINGNIQPGQYLGYSQGPSYPSYSQPPAQYPNYPQYSNYGQYPGYASASSSYSGYGYGYAQPPYKSYYPGYNEPLQYPKLEPKPKPREYHGTKETLESSNWDKTNSQASIKIKVPRYPSVHMEVDRETTNEGTATKTIFKQQY